MVSVYTLKTNLWRRIEDSPYDHILYGPSRGILVRGALHWVPQARPEAFDDSKTEVDSLTPKTFRSFQFHDDFVVVHLKFPPEQNHNRCVDTWGSCDGLLLVLDICFSCILVNPSTSQSRKFPKSSFSKSKFRLNSYRLGYDLSNDDYKVARISYHDQDDNCADNMVSVYTLKMNLWRRIEDSPYDHTLYGPSRGILVRGALHWLARKDSYGLGYDSSSDDYKVVSIAHYDYGSDFDDNIVSVYSLRISSWGRIEDSPYIHTPNGPSPGIFVNGALHWFASSFVGSNNSTVIASLDLTYENYGDVPSPVDDFVLFEELSVLGGCLCMLVSRRCGCKDVWVMKEYGVRDSWTKFTINHGCFPLCKALCLSETGEDLRSGLFLERLEDIDDPF
ncbi:F-box protein CPR1 [Camellia lanceoleosa]|uniref:F-box protein CPR1 n=1 Tax=Camellia lanceoleosa TaxID=1840588 RepID=A0ACC0J2N2_9ERIC|nr:F-box protein CPR1 [Camellia lanceoleosa]